MDYYQNINGQDVKLTKKEVTELLARWNAADEEKAAKDKLKYIEDRKLAYPPVEEQLDAILKQFKVIRDETVEAVEPELSVIIDKWEAVKLAYPKPLDPNVGN